MRGMVGASAVVIGAGGGVGRGLCLALANHGMRVMVADRDLDAATRVVAEIEHDVAAGVAVAVEADATEDQSLAELRVRAGEELGHVDVLAVTLGAILQRPLDQVTAAQWEWLWRVNVHSQISAVNTFLPLLRARDEAHIVLTAAGAGLHAAPPDTALGAYGAVKHALVGYGKNLRQELAPDAIGVTLLCPTAIAGRLAATSAVSHRELVGTDHPGVGGQPPAGRELDDGRVLGPVIIDAIRRNSFIASNQRDDLVKAIEDEHRLLVHGQD